MLQSLQITINPNVAGLNNRQKCEKAVHFLNPILSSYLFFLSVIWLKLAFFLLQNLLQLGFNLIKELC